MIILRQTRMLYSRKKKLWQDQGYIRARGTAAAVKIYHACSLAEHMIFVIIFLEAKYI